MAAWERPVTLPLSGGDRSFRFVRLTSLGGLLAFGPLFFIDSLDSAVLWYAVPAIVLWCALVLLIGLVTWTTRASDVRIDASGMEILSGHHRGRRFPWSAMAPHLVLVRREGPRVTFEIGGEVLARTRDDAEAVSFTSLAGTLRAGAQHREPEAPLGPQVATCRACGAPLTPAQTASVTCTYCQHENEVAPRVRAVASAAGASDEIQRAVTQLLRWPSARRVNAWLAASFTVAVLAWPFFVACSAWVHVARPGVGWLGLSVLVACAMSASSTFPALVALATHERRSFELLSARFAAAAPPAPGEPHGCRHCGGPLPSLTRDGTHGHTFAPSVALCAYCDATNVIGLGLAREARAARDDANSLSDLADERLAARRRRRWGAVVPVLVLLSGPYQFATVMFDLPCEGLSASCGDAHRGRWCVGGRMQEVRCDGPRGCMREGLGLRCDQSVTAPGDLCIGPQEGSSCSADGRSLLHCRGERTVLVSSCGGPRGCSLDDERIWCDSSIAQPGDMCRGEVTACRTDGLALLVCREGRFEVLHATDHCTIRDDGRLLWGGAHAVIGERCGGGVACTDDDRLLRCDRGHLVDFTPCRGPLGCASEGTSHRCDQSLGLAGEACSGEGGACRVDGRAMLRCTDGVFTEIRACPGGCEIASGRVACRARPGSR